MKNKLDLKNFEHIYDSCLLTMSCYITSLSKAETDFYDFAWKDDIFYFQSFDGSDGAIYFDVKNKQIIGVFRKNTSSRISMYPKFEIASFFEEVPCDIYEKARNHLFRCMNLEFVEPKRLFSKPKTITVPVITTALWSEKENIYSNIIYFSGFSHCM